MLEIFGNSMQVECLIENQFAERFALSHVYMKPDCHLDDNDIFIYAKMSGK